jgi:uncharacterized delta-60 repeat protein
MRVSIVVVLLICSGISYAGVDTVWTRRYNSPYHYNDTPCGVAVDNDGNVYVTGFVVDYAQPTVSDYATIKYNQYGDSLWLNYYDGLWNDDDYAIGITVDVNDNVYVCGYSMGMEATYDYTTIKYTSSGDTVWTAVLNGPWGDHDYASDFTVDDSGDVYVTGFTNGAWTYQDYMTVKYTDSGDTAWTRLYNHIADKDDAAAGLAIDEEGNVYVTGKSWDYTTRDDYVTIKYDTDGTELWVSRYNGFSDSTDIAVALCVDDNSGAIYVTGCSWSSSTDYDIVTIKYNTSGDTVWTRRYNGAADSDDKPSAIVLDATGNIIITGYSTEGTVDYCTIKYDSDGNELWSSTYDGLGNGTDRAHVLVLDDSGNVYITGESYGSGTNYDYATVKYDSYGNEVWSVRYNGNSNGHDRAYGIAVDSAGCVYVTGESFGGPGAYMDYLTIKYVQTPGIEEASVTRCAVAMVVRSSVFRYTTEIEYALAEPDRVTLAVYDIQGRLIKTLVDNYCQNGNYQMRWRGEDNNGNQAPSGVYLVQLTTSSHAITKKIVKLK